MISSAMKRMMSFTVSTKRRPLPDTSGKQAAPTTYLAKLKTTPIDPLSIDEFHNIRERFGIDGPSIMYGAYTQTTQDVRVGDIIVSEGIDYVIKGLGRWRGSPEDVYEMVLVEHVNA